MVNYFFKRFTPIVMGLLISECWEGYQLYQPKRLFCENCARNTPIYELSELIIKLYGKVNLLTGILMAQPTQNSCPKTEIFQLEIGYI